MSGVFKKFSSMNDQKTLQARVDSKVLDAFDDIAHFYHLSRNDYLRLQLKRIIAKEQSLEKRK